MKYFRYFETKIEMDDFTSNLNHNIKGTRDGHNVALKDVIVMVDDVEVMPYKILWNTTQITVSYTLYTQSGAVYEREKVVDIEENRANTVVTKTITITDMGYSFDVEFEQGVNLNKTPMYFENIDTHSVTIGIKKSNSSAYTATLETSTDGVNWTNWGSTSTTEMTKNLPVGGKLYIRASSNPGYINNSSYYNNCFTSDGKVNIGGNIMSLGYKDFGDKTSITQGYVYSGVFGNMYNLVDASELVLPATRLANYCYEYMFKGCTSLTTAPELPATTLAEYCYQGMFYGCTSLTTAPALPATTLTNQCYSNMFQECTSLTTAPALPATTLADYCYKYMFDNCSKLNYIKALFTTTPSYSYTAGWVSGVASTGTFVKNMDATWNVTGVNGIPEGWTVETASN